jgi:hypothetical protein
MLHAWRKFGLANAQHDFKNKYCGQSYFASAVRGTIEFVEQIRDRPDAVFKTRTDQYNNLLDECTVRRIGVPIEVKRCRGVLRGAHRQ